MEQRGLAELGQILRNILRDRRPSTTAYPACLPMGTKDVKFTVRKNKVCTGPTRAAKAEQKSLVQARQAQRTNQGRVPFICTL
jgi:hypothetical protein